MNKKNFITDTIFAIIIFFTIFVLPAGLCELFICHDFREGKVIEVEQNDVVIVEDTTGNIWSIKEDNYRIGETVRITIDNHHSNNVKDFEVVGIKKIVNTNP